MFDIIDAQNNTKRALRLTEDWRKVAKEDYEFVQGKQWSDTDLKALQKAGRPAITINRIRPVINLLSGYAAQNETEPDFLPRSDEDSNISRVAKGITKYALDRTNYQREKKKVFRDVITCGLGAYWTSYEFDYDRMDGKIKIERVSPFDIFVDPESVKEDLSDCQYCGRYSWESPDKLKQIYPEKEMEIATMQHKLDDTEREVETGATVDWYRKDLKKVRVVQYWYREFGTKKVFDTKAGIIDESNPKAYAMCEALGMQPISIQTENIRFATFCDNVLLEEGESPYTHKRFPLVLQYCYYSGERPEDGDILEPAGVVRDIKDAQRELNKNRSQRMHIVNQQSLGVKFWFGQIEDNVKKAIKNDSTKPGANIFLPTGVDFKDGLPANQSIGNIELENQANSDFYTISGITPESLSGQISSSMSGKAIDLRQSVTTVQTAEIFDRAKESERLLCTLLWGEKGKGGLIPQFYNQEKFIRILGKDGEHEFVQIQPGLGQPMVEQPKVGPNGSPVVDGDGNPITTLLFDLSCFDFDIIITTSQASATARKANLYQLMEAKQSGADIPFDIIMEYMDIPNKQEIKDRLQQVEGQPQTPELRMSGTLDSLPAEALSKILEQYGMQIAPQQIIEERLANKGQLENTMNATQQANVQSAIQTLADDALGNYGNVPNGMNGTM